MSVAPTPIAGYSSPHQFEPLLPASAVGELREIGDDIAQRSARLQGTVHPTTLQPLRELVRSMNSYYSNRIEGQNTHPLLIDRALHQHFDDQPDVARRQRLAIAHIDAEIALENELLAGAQPLSGAFVSSAHAALYSRLPAADRRSEQGTEVIPGVLRTDRVMVHRHDPPLPEALPAFLARFDQVYAKPWPACDRPGVVAAAHHRMAWIHPFIDGNGRACRLQTHCALWPLTGGLWSVNRGLARRRDDYFRYLSEADLPHQGDLDGRGNLSERMLSQWCRFFSDVCLDQVSFMASMLDLPGMKLRISQLVAARSREPGKGASYRPEVELPLYHLFAAGPLTRGEFQQATGLPERTASRALKGLLDDGLVASDSRTGPVRFALPLDALRLLLPGLYPEASSPSIDA
jgi:Fic family protein